MPDIEQLLRPLVDQPTREVPPVDTVRVRARRRTARRRVATGGIVVLVVVAGLAVLAPGRDDSEHVGTSGLAGTTELPRVAVPGLPASFDPATAVPLRGWGGVTPDEAANAYLATGFGGVDRPSGGLVRLVGGAEIDGSGEQASVGWEVHGGSTPDAAATLTGRLYLRDDGTASAPNWVVVASAADAVDLGPVVNTGEQVTGAVTSAFDGLVLIDVEGEDRSTTPEPPFPDGQPTMNTTFGTAGFIEGVPNDPYPLAVDVEPGAPPVLTVRARLADDQVVAIAQVVLEPPGPDAVTATTSGAGGSSTPSSVTTTVAPASSTTPNTSTTSPADLPAAPWSNPPLSSDQAPATVAAFADPAGPGAVCPADAPSDLGEGAGATARATDRGGDSAWWVAYDLPGADGEDPIQSPKRGAGKDTFFISADSFSIPEGIADPFPNKLRWADGSHGSYGIEGNGMLPTPDGVDPPWLAYLRIAGSPCLYQVKSYLGEDHLRYLIDHLRFVEGSP